MFRDCGFFYFFSIRIWTAEDDIVSDAAANPIMLNRGASAFRIRSEE
jgi:hypothetical protein